MKEIFSHILDENIDEGEDNSRRERSIDNPDRDEIDDPKEIDRTSMKNRAI